MQVLVVDCCSGASSAFNDFKNIVVSTINSITYGEGNVPAIIVRRVDEISDFVCHWQRDILNEKSKKDL